MVLRHQELLEVQENKKGIRRNRQPNPKQESSNSVEKTREE